MENTIDRGYYGQTWIAAFGQAMHQKVGRQPDMCHLHFVSRQKFTESLT